MKKQTPPTPVQSRAKKLSKPSEKQVKAAVKFADHIGELRRRIFWVALVFIAASSLAYNFRDQLLQVVMAPLHGEKLSYLTPAGGFSFIFQISMYTGLFAALPLLIYHIHAFIKPALPERARKSAGRVVIAASLLILAGISYGYFVAIPAALEFLTTFASESVLPSLTADSYLSFFLAYVAGIAALSLLPLVLMFIHWIRPLRPGGLFKSERWVIAGAFIVAAVITPTPDAVNQTMIAVPIILIYQLGVVAILVSLAKAKKADKRAARQQASIEAAKRRRQAILNQRSGLPAMSAAVVSRPLSHALDHAPVMAAAVAVAPVATIAIPAPHPHAVAPHHAKPAQPAARPMMDIVPAVKSPKPKPQANKQTMAIMDIAAPKARLVQARPARSARYQTTVRRANVLGEFARQRQQHAVASRSNTPRPTARLSMDGVIAR